MEKDIEKIQELLYEIHDNQMTLDNAIEFCSENNIQDISHLISTSNLIINKINNLAMSLDEYYFNFIKYKTKLKPTLIDPDFRQDDVSTAE